MAVQWSLYLLNMLLQCTFLTVISTSSSSTNNPANPLTKLNNSSSKSQLLIESKSAINITIKPPTKKPFKFLDDYGELPEMHDDDDDDNSNPSFTTTIKTTTVKLPSEKTEIAKDSLSKAYPSLDKKEMQISKNAKSNTIVDDVSKNKANKSGKKVSGKSGSSISKSKETGRTTMTKQTKSSTAPKINGTLSTNKVVGKPTAYPILDEEETLFQDPDEADPNQDHSKRNKFPALLMGFAPSTSKEGLKSGLFRFAKPIDNPVQKRKENTNSKIVKSNPTAADVLKTQANNSDKKESGKPVSSLPNNKATSNTTTEKQAKSFTTRKINGTLSTSKVSGKITSYSILDQEEAMFQDQDEVDPIQDRSMRNKSFALLVGFVPSTSKDGLQSRLLNFAKPIENPVQEKKETSKHFEAKNAGKDESGKSVSSLPKNKAPCGTTTKKQTNLSTSKTTSKTTVLPILDEEETLFQDPNATDSNQDHSIRNKSLAPLTGFLPSTSKEGLESGLLKFVKPIENPMQEKNKNLIIKNAKSNISATNLLKTTSKVAGKTTAFPILDEEETLFQEPDEGGHNQDHSIGNKSPAPLMGFLRSTSKEGLECGLFKFANPIENPMQKKKEGSKHFEAKNAGKEESGKVSSLPKNRAPGSTTTKKQTNSWTSKVTGKTTAYPILNEEETLFQDPDEADSNQNHSIGNKPSALLTEIVPSTSMEGLRSELFKFAGPIENPVQEKKENPIIKIDKSNPTAADVLKTRPKKADKKESGISASSLPKIADSGVTTKRYNRTLSTSEARDTTTTYAILDEEETLFQDRDETAEDQSTRKGSLVRLARHVPSTSKDGLQVALLESAEPIENPVQVPFDTQFLDAGSGEVTETKEPTTGSSPISISSSVIPSTVATTDADINERCQAGYLPVGSSCVDETLILGVSLGVASTLILVLATALIVLGCKACCGSLARKRKKEQEAKKESSSSNRETDQSTIDSASEAEENPRPGEEISQSDIFTDFVPNISNISDNMLSKEYVIQRPKL